MMRHLKANSLLLAAVALAASEIQAAQYTVSWNGAASLDWQSSGNWNGGVVPGNNGSDTYVAEFASAQAAPVVISLGSPVAVDQLRILRDPNLTLGLAGEKLTLTGGASGVGVSSPDTDNQINSPVLGPVLAANVELVPAVAGGVIQFNLGSTNSVTGNAPRGLAISGVVSGNAGITKIGRGALDLANANTYTGITTVQQNWVYVSADAPNGAAGALGNATSAVEVGNASTANAADTGLVTNGGVTIGRNININARQSPTAAGVSYLGGSTAQTDASSIYAGTITLNRNAQLISSTTGDHVVDFQGKITGSGGLLKRSSGTVRLSNAGNDFTGATSVRGGYLVVAADAPGGPGGSAGALGSATSAVVLGDANTTSNYGMLTGGPVTIGRAISLTALDPANTAVGSLGGSATQTAGSRFTGAISLGRDVRLQSFTAGGNAVEFGGVISSPTAARGIGVAGTGIVTLSADNLYTGATEVGVDGQGATLRINGTHTGGGRYAVLAGATLGGSGSVVTGAGANGLTVNEGGTLAPGQGGTPSLFTVFGDTALGGTLALDLGSTTDDRLAVSGALSIGETSVLDLAIQADLSEPVYVLATYGALQGQWLPANIHNLPAGYELQYDYQGTQIALVIPEPAMMLFASLALPSLRVRRRRR